MYSTKILLDSISPAGKRITTWELTYPRFVHAELLTHRFFSKNSASSRAIPNKVMLQRIKDDPAHFVWYGKNQAGMQAKEEMEPENKALFIKEWLIARDLMVAAAERMAALGAHKQMVNRITEPWMYITVLLTTTELDNWFLQRDHPDAQPEIAWVAKDMRTKWDANKPDLLMPGEWHLPLLDADERFKIASMPGNALYDNFIRTCKQIVTGRCARVSYLTHDGKRDFTEDVKLHDKLISSNHWSPFEHAAQCLQKKERVGNFIGWKQYRAEVDPHFDDYKGE